MKKLTLIILCILLLSGCVAPAAEPSPSTAEPTGGSERVTVNQTENKALESWLSLKDLSGETIDFLGDDVVGIDLGYSVCWNFDNEGYRKVKKGDRVNGCEVMELISNYAVSNGNAACRTSQLSLGKTAVMTGVIKVSQYDVAFYPYPSDEGDNFVFLGERTDDWEKKYQQASMLAVGGNKSVAVQPIRILISYPDKNGVITELSTFLSNDPTDSMEYLKTFEEPIYLEAEVQLASVTFSARNMGDGIEDTVGNGSIGWLTEAGGEGSIAIRAKL